MVEGEGRLCGAVAVGGQRKWQEEVGGVRRWWNVKEDGERLGKAERSGR